MRNLYKLLVPFKLRDMIWRMRHSDEIKERLKDPKYAYLHYKLLFVHIPKSAGISIHKSLFKINSPGHFTSGSACKERFTDQEWKQLYKFTFVRNPYTRLYSAYNYLATGGRQTKLDKKYQEELNSYTNFEDFVLKGLKSAINKEILHFIPQMKLITDDKDNLIVDFIGKFENLEDDIKKLSKKTPKKIPIELEFHNKGKKRITDYREVYTDEMIQVIEEVYGNDLKQLGYQFPTTE